VSKAPIEMMLDGVARKAIPVTEIVCSDEMPHATHEGELIIGPLTLHCHQLNTGERVIDEESVMRFLDFLEGRAR
jgi:hypothetical protein